MSLSPVKFEDTLRALLEQQEFLLLVQLSRMWLRDQSLSEKAVILYAKALIELGCIEEVEVLLENKKTVESIAVLVEASLKCEQWERSLSRIAQLKNASKNHPRLSEFLSRARVAKEQDPQRLIRSHLLEKRLKGIEIMLCKGKRQQARVYLEHWKKDLPNHRRVHDLYAVSRGDLDFDQGWDELLQAVFEQIHDDDQTHKIRIHSSDLSYTSEDTEDQTLLITDPIFEETDKLENTDGTDSILLIREGALVEESEPLGEISLNDENVVVFHDQELTEPQIILQKEKVKVAPAKKKIKKKSSAFMWFVFFSVLSVSMVTMVSWLLDKGRTSIKESLSKAILSADMQELENRKQILLHKLKTTSFLQEETEDALGLTCLVLWYDFSKSQTDLECAEKYIQTDYTRQVYSVLSGLAEDDLEDIEQELVDMDIHDDISFWVLREVELHYGTLEPTNRKEARLVIQDMQMGIPKENLDEVSTPWYELERLEFRWGDFSTEEKETKLARLQNPNVLAVLGAQKHSRVLLLQSILEMETGNKRRAKLYRLEALKRDPENGRLRYWLGWDYYEEGDLFKANESWSSCVQSDVECAMSKVMVLIDMDRLEEVDELISETESLQFRQRIIHQWIEWAQKDIPSFEHPVFADLLYEQERWRNIFSHAQQEVQDWKDKKRSFQELSWRGLFFLSLDVAAKDTQKARKILSMAIQKQGSATSFVRILGWMNKNDNLPHSDLWKLYLGQNPTGFAAKKVREEVP